MNVYAEGDKKIKKMEHGWEEDAERELPEAKYSFEIPPEPISDEQIDEFYEADVVVVGAGSAGVVAALSAAEQGASVIVMQNKSHIKTQGQGAAAFGSKRQTIACDNRMRSEIMRLKSVFEGGLANYDMMNLWFDKSGEAMDWILDHTEPVGIHAVFDDYGDWENSDDWTKTCPVSSKWTGPQGTGAQVMIDALLPQAEAAGVQFVYNVTGEQLVREDNGTGRVTAVIGEKKDGGYVKMTAHKGIILCTGGYEANEEMRDKWLAHAAPYKRLSDNNGEGIAMGMWVGADVDPAPHASNVHYYGRKQAWGSGVPWLRVNKAGERLGNEDISFGFLAFLEVNSEDHVAFQIFDSDYDVYYPRMIENGGALFRTVPSAEKFASKANISPDVDTTGMSDLDKVFEFCVEDGTAIRADTIEELAEKAGIDGKTLAATIERYNELYDLGCDLDFGKKPSRMHAVRKPPFYAIKRTAYILGTLNGLVINTDMQVLDKQGQVIPGLYAAGNASGGRFFGGIAQCMTAPAATISRAVTWGYLAGINAANE